MVQVLRPTSSISSRARRGLVPASMAWIVLWILPGCSTEPITGRWRVDPVAESETTPMGALAYQELLKDVQLSTDPAQVELVRRVGQRIARVTDARMEAEGRQKYEWEFKVIKDDKSVNAWCLPGGKVAFYTAILPVCASEGGVAVVMGHEVGHAYAEHGGSRIQLQGIASGLAGLAQTALGSEGASTTSKMAVAALGLGYKVGVELPFGREDESGADHIGLVLMAEAGYDPREAVAFWKRMQEATGGAGTPQWLSTHPSPNNRIQRLEELMPQAMEIYERTRAGAAAARPQP